MTSAKNKSKRETSQEIITVDGEERQITRNNLGRFAKGVSGNPKGRPKGSKNRTVIVKQAIEEALARNMAEDASVIIEQAISMAKAGDKDMIKFLLGDVLKEVRKDHEADEDQKRIGKIEISISPYTGPDNNAVKDVLEGEFAEIEANIHDSP